MTRFYIIKYKRISINTWNNVFTHTLTTIPPYPLLAATTTHDDSTSEFSPVCYDPITTGTIDSDGDSLCDVWEQDGIDYDGDGIPDLELENADPMKKDIYVIVDWMEGQEPEKTSLDDVVNVFRNAPSGGIALHYEKSGQVPTISTIDTGGNAEPIYQMAEDNFGDDLGDDLAGIGARRVAYHYAVFVNNIVHEGKSVSGWATPYGNVLLVALGDYSSEEKARWKVEAGTFMHELGHNLGLYHGGNNNDNYKPNYLSVMNYSFQAEYNLAGRPLDYSRITLDPLNESSLDENVGIPCDPSSDALRGWYNTVYWFSDNDNDVPILCGGINWNRNGDDTETGVNIDINRDGAQTVLHVVDP